MLENDNGAEKNRRERRMREWKRQKEFIYGLESYFSTLSAQDLRTHSEFVNCSFTIELQRIIVSFLVCFYFFVSECMSWSNRRDDLFCCPIECNFHFFDIKFVNESTTEWSPVFVIVNSLCRPFFYFFDFQWMIEEELHISPLGPASLCPLSREHDTDTHSIVTGKTFFFCLHVEELAISSPQVVWVVPVNVSESAHRRRLMSQMDNSQKIFDNKVEFSVVSLERGLARCHDISLKPPHRLSFGLRCRSTLFFVFFSVNLHNSSIDHHFVPET